MLSSGINIPCQKAKKQSGPMGRCDINSDAG